MIEPVTDDILNTASATEQSADLNVEHIQEQPQKQPEGECLMEATGLLKAYHGRTVVKGVNIHVNRGEIVGLLGPNGAGKTTSFYMIMGLIKPDAGQVMFNGVDISQEPMYVRARMGMGYLAQEPSIFRKLTVEDTPLSSMPAAVPCAALRDRAR